MPLVSTPGASNANSLLSITRADALALESPHASAWISISNTSTKEALLIKATRLFTSRICLAGTATYADQALTLPRSGLLNLNGYELDSTVIPLEAELAVFEWALTLISSDTSKDSDISVQGINKIKAGPIEIGFNKQTVLAGNSVPTHVLSYIPKSWLCDDYGITYSNGSLEFCVY